jgi:endogenous inhibitor of DNA gyrase (YacG/DUF329 family)
MARITCPTCQRIFDTGETPVMPFCSRRCQAIDLGRWLNEQYGMPIEGEERWAEADEQSPESWSGNESE